MAVVEWGVGARPSFFFVVSDVTRVGQPEFNFRFVFVVKSKFSAVKDDVVRSTTAVCVCFFFLSSERVCCCST